MQKQLIKIILEFLKSLYNIFYWKYNTGDTPSN